MRKTSAYARKMRRQPERAQFNGAEWINTLQRCRGYTDEPIPGAFNADGGQTVTAANGAALRVRAAFDVIKTATVAPDDMEPHDLLTHAVGVAWLRAIEIAGHEPGKNPMLPILKLGTNAVQRLGERRRMTGAWGFDGPAIQQVADALDVYEEILMNSSPLQMANASRRREKLLLDMQKK